MGPKLVLFAHQIQLGHFLFSASRFALPPPNPGPVQPATSELIDL